MTPRFSAKLHHQSTHKTGTIPLATMFLMGGLMGYLTHFVSNRPTDSNKQALTTTHTPPDRKKLDKPASTAADNNVTLHPAIEPFARHRMQVSKLHNLYVEESGNPKGYPVIYVHGGPGAGLSEEYRQFFNPRFFRIIGFDQRGCGRSLPTGELKENTTQDLVGDIQTIRKNLGIEHDAYLLFGGSWGSLLSLASAQTHPEHVAGLILRGISLGRLTDTNWSTQPENGVFHLYPEANAYYLKGVEGITPDPEDVKQGRNPVLGMYYRVFTEPGYTEAQRLTAAKYWYLGESYRSGQKLADKDLNTPIEAYWGEEFEAAKLVCHYYYNNAFMSPSDQLLQQAGRLKSVPFIRIFNGRQDLSTPAKRAYDLYKALQAKGVDHAQMEIIEDAGHSAWSDPMKVRLLKALADFEAQVGTGFQGAL